MLDSWVEFPLSLLNPKQDLVRKRGAFLFASVLNLTSLPQPTWPDIAAEGISSATLGVQGTGSTFSMPKDVLAKRVFVEGGAQGEWGRD